MATYKEQMLRAWDEWELETKPEAADPDDFIEWALAHRKLAARPQDVKSILRKQVTTVLRQAVRVDDEGTMYRAKQCVMILVGGTYHRRWFDTDSGGTPNLREKSTHQRREGIANSVYRAMCDIEHMRRVFPEEQLNFVLDFNDDYLDRKAVADQSEGDEDEEGAAS